MLGPDLEWMFGRGEDEMMTRALCERWVASAISLRSGKWTIVGAKVDSVQIRDGKVHVEVFESMTARGVFRGILRLVLGAGEIAVNPGALRLPGGRGARAELNYEGWPAEIEILADCEADGCWSVMTKTVWWCQTEVEL